jgi:hypothetical protein
MYRDIRSGSRHSHRSYPSTLTGTMVALARIDVAYAGVG